MALVRSRLVSNHGGPIPLKAGAAGRTCARSPNEPKNRASFDTLSDATGFCSQGKGRLSSSDLKPGLNATEAA